VRDRNQLTLTRAKDNPGRVVSYEYHAAGRLIRVTDAAGGLTESLYDATMLPLCPGNRVRYIWSSRFPCSATPNPASLTHVERVKARGVDQPATNPWS
jgi:YD repeat-containing protein